MLDTTPLVVIGILVVVSLIILLIMGLRDSSDYDPLEKRLLEFVSRGEMASLEEIEMSQSFLERVILPMANKFGAFALRFTPKKALQEIEKKLELAGNPEKLTANSFFSARVFARISQN